MARLDRNGYPSNPRSIFIGIKRDNIPSKEAFEQALSNGTEILISHRCYGEWGTILGKISKITHFPDGRVIHFPQNLQRSTLKWPEAVLWIPNQGQCGILD